MTKNMLPMKTGSGIVGKLVAIIIGLAVLMLVIKYPGDVAGWVKDCVRLLTSIVSGIAAFFQQLGH
jgi:superfamily II helicase